MVNEYSILSNMYYQNSIKHDNMAKIKIQDYIIELSREDATEFMSIQYEYRCNLIIKDLLGRELRKISFNEFQAQQLIDSINTFVYDDYMEIYALSNINGPTIYESYTISLKAIKQDTEEHYIQFQILCFNTIYQSIVPVLSITMSLDDLDKLVDTMFFVYLIDIASEREGIYQT